MMRDLQIRKGALVRIVSLSLGLILLSTLTAHAQAPAPGAGTPAGNATAMVVKFKVKEGMNEAFEKAFRDMEKGVASSEPGNVTYDLFHLAGDPQTYVVFEHYQNLAAVAAHGKTEHARQLIAALNGLLDGRPDAMRLEFVSSKQKP
jgi:(4S)-4-hydroxy-5-phosphonooxypentane-2,3-dione isomerase